MQRERERERGCDTVCVMAQALISLAYVHARVNVRVVLDY
jgi:hypothetical protein